ncbi:MAG: 2OG-Fe(II) oxygenase [Oligoflexia bacterium]|nr:2OG-Fe(II) oxygenase [Oligoflexia bacterium]
MIAEIDWSSAEDLPDGVSPRWRDAETLRRAAEDRVANPGLSVLRRFLAPAFSQVLAREAQALPMQGMDTDTDTDTAHGHCCLVKQRLPALARLMADELTRRILGAVIGVTLPPRVVMHVWRHEPGDKPETSREGPRDGPRDAVHFALGLNLGWAAADGGALALGSLNPDGQPDQTQRWLPHDGDLCLFLPTAMSWRAVEPARRTRWSVAGWWALP